MFGLEERKDEEKFDLEKEMQNPSQNRKLKERIDGRIQELKKILREGDTKEEYDEFGVLLHAYAALQKVMVRVQNP